MKEALKYGIYLTTYTLFYHGLYYRPPIIGMLSKTLDNIHTFFKPKTKKTIEEN
jgi:hypothetical protein